MCLDNYIGLKNCGLPVPTSGKYVNTLPSISTELADKIANSEQLSFKGVWDEIKERAFVKFRNDIINTLFEDINFNPTAYQTQRLLKSQPSNLIVIPKAPEYRGVYIMLPESKYSELRGNYIYIYSAETSDVNTTLKVWDVNDGKELYTQDVTIQPGLNEIDFNQVYELRYRILELFIGIDCENIDTIQTVNELYYWTGDDCSCSQNYTFGRGIFQIYPGTFSKSLILTYDNINKVGIGQGVTVQADIGCSIDQFICQNIKYLGDSLLYLLGSELLLEKLGTPRLNYWASTNLEGTEKMMNSFNETYKSFLKTALKRIPLTGQGFCFDCEETFITTTKDLDP